MTDAAVGLLSEAYGGARLARTAPISPILILSYVGQCVLGMPRSY